MINTEPARLLVQAADLVRLSSHRPDVSQHPWTVVTLAHFHPALVNVEYT